VTLATRRVVLAPGETPGGQTEIGAQGEPLSSFLPQVMAHYLFHYYPAFKDLV